MIQTEDLLYRLNEGLLAGQSHARTRVDLARWVGVSERTLQQLVGELIDRGVLVGSSCGRNPGYYIITNEEELEAGTSHIVARARASFQRVSKLRAAAAREFGPQTDRLFDLEGVPAP